MTLLRFASCCCCAVLILLPGTAPASIIFDDFNLDEGHFIDPPSFSTSNANIAGSSTADQILTDEPFEGLGQEKLVINQAGAGFPTRLRFLSGSGTPANNISFTTSDAEDGWIGFFLKIGVPGWTVQPYLEGPENNGGSPKTLNGDGQWHLYEWNLDDETGGVNGWGQVLGIQPGDADFQVGTYTWDSIVFRGPDIPSSTIYLDFVAKSDSGSIATLTVPEPTAFRFAALGAFGLLRVRRRRV